MTTDTAPTPAPAAGGRGAREDRAPGPIARVGIYYREVVSELRKVNYPSRTMLGTYTIVVLVFVSVMTALVAGLDYGLSKGVVALFS